MRKQHFVSLGAVIAMALALALTGCHHQPPPPPPAPAAPPPAAPAPAPTVTISADPTDVVRGSQSTLTWQSQNAIRVELNGAAVNLNGSQSVSPDASTDYQAIATSADGRTANASVHVTVNEPPPPPPPPAPVAEDINQLFTENVRDAFFDYDKALIRPDAETALQADAQFLKAHPDLNIVVEGHCDDRGSAEYNMGLGQRRANAVQAYLVQQGVDASRIQVISYGKERPFCTQDNDDCWQQNRRGHIIRGQ